MAYDFNKIAENYDSLNHIMTFGLDRRWRRHAVSQLAYAHTSTLAKQLSSKPTALDVACGTGDLSIELLKRGFSVTGIDLSEKMLEIARQKTSSPDFQSSSFNFQSANAEALPFPDASFGAVTCAFGVRNFAHLEQGLSEMLRVIKPGGRMVILELATPDSKLIRPFYNLYSKYIIPWLGSRIAGNREAYTYLPESISRFPKGKDFLSILQKPIYKIQNARQRKLFFGVCRLYVFEKA